MSLPSEVLSKPFLITLHQKSVNATVTTDAEELPHLVHLPGSELPLQLRQKSKKFWLDVLLHHDLRCFPTNARLFSSALNVSKMQCSPPESRRIGSFTHLRTGKIISSLVSSSSFLAKRHLENCFKKLNNNVLQSEHCLAVHLYIVLNTVTQNRIHVQNPFTLHLPK